MTDIESIRGDLDKIVKRIFDLYDRIIAGNMIEVAKELNDTIILSYTEYGLDRTDLMRQLAYRLMPGEWQWRILPRNTISNNSRPLFHILSYTERDITWINQII